MSTLASLALFGYLVSGVVWWVGSACRRDAARYEIMKENER